MCICICIWWAVFVFVFGPIFVIVFVFVFVFETPEKNVFVFVFVFDKTYLTPALHPALSQATTSSGCMLLLLSTLHPVNKSSAAPIWDVYNYGNSSPLVQQTTEAKSHHIVCCWPPSFPVDSECILCCLVCIFEHVLVYCIYMEMILDIIMVSAWQCDHYIAVYLGQLVTGPLQRISPLFVPESRICM